MLSPYTFVIIYAAHLVHFTLMPIFCLGNITRTCCDSLPGLTTLCPVLLHLCSWPWAVGERCTFESNSHLSICFPYWTLTWPPSSESSVHVWGHLGSVSQCFTLCQMEGSKELNENIILWGVRNFVKWMNFNKSKNVIWACIVIMYMALF